MSSQPQVSDPHAGVPETPKAKAAPPKAMITARQVPPNEAPRSIILGSSTDLGEEAAPTMNEHRYGIYHRLCISPRPRPIGTLLDRGQLLQDQGAFKVGLFQVAPPVRWECTALGLG